MTEFKFFCPHCGKQIQCDTSYAGTEINCPVCRQAIVVPQVPRAGTLPPPVMVKSRALQNILLILAALLVLAGLVIVGWFGYSKIKMHKSVPGLVSLWSGEGDGGDSIGGNKMILTDITFAEGKAGRAFSFNGTSSSIKIPASPSMDVGAHGSFTLMAWIKPLELDGPHPMFEWSDTLPVTLHIGLRPSESGVLCSTFTDTGGSRFVLSNPGTLVNGVFQHVTMTYDKASGTGTIYLNGVVVGQRQVSGNVNSKGDLLISHRDTRQGDWSSNRSFAGLMDEIAIYDRALSASEIKAICMEQNHGEPLTLPTSSTGWFENWMQ